MPIKILSGGTQPHGVVSQMSKTDIATMTQHAANGTCLVVVIEMPTMFTGRLAAAHGARAVLRFKQRIHARCGRAFPPATPLAH